MGPKGKITQLITEGFFDNLKRSADIIDRLAEKGSNYKATDLTSPLLALVNNGTLSREKIDDMWSYKKA